MAKFINMLKKEIGGLHEAAYLLGAFAFLSQILALLRDKLLAYRFGAGAELDLYYAAFRIPDLIFVIFASVVSSSILIPFFIDHFRKGEKQGKKFVDDVFSVFFLLLILVSIIAFIITPYLVQKFLPGFIGESHGDLIIMTRILLLSPIFLGLSNFFSSLTQMHGRFLVYALSPLVYNVGIIFGVLALYPIFGLKGLAYGVVVGALLHVGIQAPFVIYKNLFPSFSFSIDWQSLKEVIFVSIPRTITLSSNQIASFFLVALASLMSAGSIAVFNLAWNLQSVPLSIIGVSYSSAVFPALSRFFLEKRKELFLERMIESARHIIFWSVPATILFVVLRAQIVRVIFGAGEFDWSDTRLTAAALALFVFSVAGQGLILLFVRAYYAEGKTKKPLYINIISSVFMILLGLVLVKGALYMPTFLFFLEEILKVSGQAGTLVLLLPFAYSAGILLNTLLHWLMFENDYPGFSKPVLFTLFHSFAASVIMGYTTFASLRLFDIFPMEKVWGVFLQGFLAGICGITALILSLVLLRNREIREMWQSLHGRIWKSRVVIPEQEVL